MAFFLLVLLALQACDKFEYSPYEVRLDKNERDVNNRSIERIKALNISPSDTLRFVLTADVQGFYSDDDDLVDALNKRNDIAFVLLGGDITDFGLLKEFKWIYQSFERMKVPYVAVIGNHDATNNGKQVYEAMYGDFNFSFTVADRKFIFLNTNYLEFDKNAPDLEWLESELADASSYLNTFVVSHIPPTNVEFGADKATEYENLLEQHNVSMSIHGHNHNYDYYKVKEGGVDHLNVSTTSKREYIVMNVIGKDVQFERVNF
ncbi:metallophosphoesterase family protein [Pontibacter silvestris]|uniref:Metallophosphoesterase family protein n=1 Tax=Pontibacter silvestris TaxID=2305183 RepID=A0ABW4WS85_9BACT|nr:metallophosphoesterase [Pontibacter silvestris]MCC9137844.1 metallophosphoesterase [Pontibacter silvestris]